MARSWLKVGSWLLRWWSTSNRPTKNGAPRGVFVGHFDEGLHGGGEVLGSRQLCCRGEVRRRLHRNSQGKAAGEGLLGGRSRASSIETSTTSMLLWKLETYFNGTSFVWVSPQIFSVLNMADQLEIKLMHGYRHWQFSAPVNPQSDPIWLDHSTHLGSFDPFKQKGSSFLGTTWYWFASLSSWVGKDSDRLPLPIHVTFHCSFWE